MKKRILLLILFAVLATFSMLLSTAKGSVDIPLGEVIGILGGAQGGANAQILWNIRLPRTIVAPGCRSPPSRTKSPFTSSVF